MARSVLAVAIAAAIAVAVIAAPPSHQITSLPGYGTLLSKNYAGYVDIGNSRKLFYWFVESEHAPATDPVVLWLNGGPGCSSLIGLFEENGPYTMRHGGAFQLNEFRWTTNASMLYLESPAGVGFSVDSNPPIQWDDTNTAKAAYTFLQNWFALYPEYTKNEFFLSGESYAGHYVPQLAYEILHGSDKTLLANTKGFMVGNPCTDASGCGNDDPTLDPFLAYNGFRALDNAIPVDSNANYDPYDLLVPTCDSEQLTRYIRFPHPVVDSFRRRLQKMKQRLNGAPFPYGPCADNYVTSWLNQANIQSILGVTGITWSDCSNTVNYNFNPNGVVPLYEEFMDNTTWSMMIYSGTSDSVVNFVGTQTAVMNMNRTLAVDEFKAWNYPYVYDTAQTQLGGFYLEFDRIAWAGVRNAGHMVPQFNPPAAKELFMSFITTGKPGRM